MQDNDESLAFIRHLFEPPTGSVEVEDLVVYLSGRADEELAERLESLLIESAEARSLLYSVRESLEKMKAAPLSEFASASENESRVLAAWRKVLSMASSLRSQSERFSAGLGNYLVYLSSLSRYAAVRGAGEGVVLQTSGDFSLPVTVTADADAQGNLVLELDFAASPDLPAVEFVLVQVNVGNTMQTVAIADFAERIQITVPNLAEEIVLELGLSPELLHIVLSHTQEVPSCSVLFAEIVPVPEWLPIVIQLQPRIESGRLTLELDFKAEDLAQFKDRKFQMIYVAEGVSQVLGEWPISTFEPGRVVLEAPWPFERPVMASSSNIAARISK